MHKSLNGTAVNLTSENQTMKTFIRMIPAICALLLTLTWTAVAEEEDPFLVAMSFTSEENAGESEEDVEFIRQAAEKGSPEAQNKLGRMYAFGSSGVPVDRKEAVKWFRKAADRGNAEAQFDLGCCYEYGKGVRKNAGKAAELYRLAAEQGYAPAQFQLALCLQYGKGVLEDKYDAVKWYRKAAEQGHINAQVNLALCYEKGIGVKKDENLARKWLHKAAGQGDESGRDKLLFMESEPIAICYHHPSIKIACNSCGRVIDPIFSVHDYKGENYYLCSDCLTLTHCQYCRAPAVEFEDGSRLCRDCSRDAVNDPTLALAIFQEVRESLLLRNWMYTYHEIEFELGTRSELGLQREDDPQKMSRYESEIVDGEPRYTVRILTNLPQDIFRIAAAQALALDWVAETVPPVMDDPDARDGFCLYVAQTLASGEELSRTREMVKRITEDGRFVNISKLVRNKTLAEDWRKYLRTEFKKENRKMPLKEQTDNRTAQKRADVIKENEERSEVREKPKLAAKALIYPRGLPERPQLRSPQSERKNDLINTQTLLRNGLRRENQEEQLPPPSNRETDLSSTQKVIKNGLRRNR